MRSNRDAPAGPGSRALRGPPSRVPSKLGTSPTALGSQGLVTSPRARLVSHSPLAQPPSRLDSVRREQPGRLRVATRVCAAASQRGFSVRRAGRVVAGARGRIAPKATRALPGLSTCRLGQYHCRDGGCPAPVRGCARWRTRPPPRGKSCECPSRLPSRIFRQAAKRPSSARTPTPQSTARGRGTYQDLGDLRPWRTESQTPFGPS